MTCGFWNVNGWTKNVDKNRLLSCCIIDSGLDIVGIAESHLRDSDKIDVEGYQWLGNNRKHIHVRARAGSGGVGILMSQNFLSQHNVQVVDSDTEGIIWVKCTNTVTNDHFFVCVVYLPPEFSARSVNIHEFMDTLHLFSQNPATNTENSAQSRSERIFMELTLFVYNTNSQYFCIKSGLNNLRYKRYNRNETEGHIFFCNLYFHRKRDIYTVYKLLSPQEDIYFTFISCSIIY